MGRAPEEDQGDPSPELCIAHFASLAVQLKQLHVPKNLMDKQTSALPLSSSIVVDW